MREEAYRHVLNNVDELKELPFGTMIQCLVGVSLLNGYLQWQSINTEITGSVLQLEKLLQLAPLAIMSALGLLFQWYTMLLFQTRWEKNRGSGVKLFWAQLLPSSFSAVTILVNIWENTQTVRMLGTLLIAYWQSIAILVVTDDLSTPILGFVAGILWRLLASLLFLQPFQCIGLELQMVGEHYRLCLT